MKKIFPVILIIIVLFVSFFAYSGFYGIKDPYGEEDLFVVEKGESILDISHRLEEEGFINNQYFFVSYVMITGKRGALKAGTYGMSSAMSVSQIAGKFASGKVKENRITVIEGWNLHDIAGYLENEGYGSKEEFYQLAGRPPSYENGRVKSQYPGKMEKEFAFLEDKPDDLPLEGYLFPDTYLVSPQAKVKDILHVLLSNFEKRALPEIGEEDILEIITIASLIEKEVITYEDKRLVSGIIRKRLEKGMPLQVDATVTYLTGRKSVDVSIAETQINSPYNTYMNPGPPKGPISNPGLESIKAALNPKESDYLYYLSKPSGETVFSRTLKEHNIAKDKYLR